MFACPFCSSETPADKKFCKRCGKGLHCPNPECKAPLEMGGEFCVECGTPYSSTTSTVEITSGVSANQFKYYLNQQGKNRVVHTSLSLSDRGMEAVAPYVFEQLLTNQGSQSQPIMKAIDRKQLNSHPQLQPSLFNPEVQDAEFTEEPRPVVHEAPSAKPIEGAARYFVLSGEFLVAKKKDFKGASMAEQQRNFLVMYLSAYNQILDKPVPNEKHLRDAADKADLWDGNFHKAIERQIKSVMMPVEGGFLINDDGEKEVARILALMENSSSEPGFEYWKKDLNGGTERHRLSDKDKTRLDGWAKEEVDLGKLEVRDVKAARDYALVAFWILTVKLKKVDAIHRLEAYYFLKKKFDIVSVTSQAFGKAVMDDEKEKFFRKNGESHFLTTEAIDLLNGWYEGKPIQTEKVVSEEAKS